MNHVLIKECLSLLTEFSHTHTHTHTHTHSHRCFKGGIICQPDPSSEQPPLPPRLAAEGNQGMKVMGRALVQANLKECAKKFWTLFLNVCIVEERVCVCVWMGERGR
jgi:hypothetical protein